MIVERRPGGAYVWECDDCGARFERAAHRGPRRSVCKPCQNNRAWRRVNPDIRRRGRVNHRRLAGRAGEC